MTECDVTKVVLSGLRDPYELVSPYATWDEEALFVVQLIVALEAVIPEALTPEITGPATGLFTVTVILLVAVLPTSSMPMTVSVCGPFIAAAVFQLIENGPAPAVTPVILEPSS